MEKVYMIVERERDENNRLYSRFYDDGNAYATKEKADEIADTMNKAYGTYDTWYKTWTFGVEELDLIA